MFRLWLALLIGLCSACSNNPYPEADNQGKVLYLPFATPPKTLDPAISYGTADTVITNKVFDTLLAYEYLTRPYTLMPSMAQEIPEPQILDGTRVRYVFRLRPHLSFAVDDCFRKVKESKGKAEGKRAVSAQDFVFQIYRIADPELTSPVVEPFSNLEGFAEFRAALEQRRKKDPGFSKLPLVEQYAAFDQLTGAVATDESTLQITLKEPYPQILYWFAMPFTTPIAWEAAEYYDGTEGRAPLSEHPVSTGAFVLKTYEKQARMVLVRNPDWWGLKNPGAPGTVFPEVGPGAENDDLRDAVGKPLPLVDRVDYRWEQETIPAFSKFLQGYYDMSGIARESFEKVMHEGGLSPDMTRRGVRLSRSVEPGVYYIGFNFDDPHVGRAGGERTRLLRQAMSLAIDVEEYLRLFSNGRGKPAHSPVPPGIFGYDESYENPFRKPNLARARELLKQAGLEGGIDPKTKKPLRLTFDVPDTSPEGRMRFMFWVNQWRKLGINVELSATNYNQFYAKMLKGSYQIYTWGWMADYPDPENFLFLLTGPMARSESHGPNNANFKHAEYDRLFGLMRTRENDEERLKIIAEMRKILEVERPWIELFHPEAYALVHGWLKNVRASGISTIPTTKYYDLVPPTRKEQRSAWNKPLYYPAWILLGLFLAVLIPGVVSYYKERT